jgi:hypothetical protein
MLVNGILKGISLALTTNNSEMTGKTNDDDIHDEVSVNFE